MDAKTQDVPRLAKWLGPNGFLVFVALVLLGGMGYLIIERVIDREDQILAEERIIRERLIVLQQEITSANEDSQRRFQEWADLQRAQNETLSSGISIIQDWLRAGCYAAANGDAQAQAHCNDVASPRR